MRVSLDNGNGAVCDKCNKALLPDEIVKIKSFQPDVDPDKFSSGCYSCEKIADLCHECYCNLMEWFN